MKRCYLFILMSIIIIGNSLSCYATEPDPLTYVKSQKGQISFYYENLITGEKTSYNADKVFPAASTIKLPLVLYLYQLAAEKKINLDEHMTYTRSYYYGGTGVIQHQKAGTKYTLRSLAQNALKHSDNIAYYMLRNRVGRSNFEKYLKKLGGSLVGSRGINSMNCRDYSLYLKAFYKFIEENPELGKELQSYATNTEFEDHITGGIKDTLVAHKIGWLPKLNLYHDAGIVYDKQPYILAIFTQNISYERQKQLFQKLSSNVHTYHLKEQMMPLKSFIVNQGGTMQWNAQSKTTTAYYNNNTLEINNNHILLNGSITDYSYYVNDGITYISEELINSVKN